MVSNDDSCADNPGSMLRRSIYEEIHFTSHHGNYDKKQVRTSEEAQAYYLLKKTINYSRHSKCLNISKQSVWVLIMYSKFKQ